MVACPEARAEGSTVSKEATAGSKKFDKMSVGFSKHASETHSPYLICEYRGRRSEKTNYQARKEHRVLQFRLHAELVDILGF